MTEPADREGVVTHVYLVCALFGHDGWHCARCGYVERQDDWSLAGPPKESS